ncbi:ATPase [Roseovarius sp. SCSIO 43702]|uniref:ATPase n=1 Tax=Roseovarius sp. SCSIO 43702 TaxID=2823043 RepID=UPI001C734078|nr:ATPase [Roseovarius sp. SCSIO 43702]QYX55970.1 ATPase [Roseovarius sp. SCSIO 43702]
MSMADEMQVRIRLPGTALFDGPATRLSGVAADGGFGILPNHVDFVTALVPSVLLVTQGDGRERIFGIDDGTLVKKGHEVDIAVQRGVEAPDMASLDAVVGDFFDTMEDEERAARAALSRLEADMVRRFAGLRTQP